MNETRKTNLDAVKDYIAENGAYNFIFAEWLEMKVSDIAREVRSALDEYASFEEIFNEVLHGGMSLKWKKRFLEEAGEYLSEDDIQIVKNAFTRIESIFAEERMERIKEFAEQVKGKTIMVSCALDDDSLSVGFSDVTPVIEITDDGYCLSVRSGGANLKIKNADIIHYDEDEDEDEDVNEAFGRNWYGFILENDTRIIVKIND